MTLLVTFAVTNANFRHMMVSYLCRHNATAVRLFLPETPHRLEKFHRICLYHERAMFPTFVFNRGK